MPERGLSLWPAFGLGLAVAVGHGLARFSYALLLPAMREDLAWTYAQAGWMNTANALGYVFGALSGYVLLRRQQPARLFTGGLWLTLVTLPVTGVSENAAWLTLARLASGIGAAWVFSCGSALIAVRYQDDVHRRGTATGLYFAGAGLGITLSALTVDPLLALFGVASWPYAWLLLGLLAALLSIWPLREAAQVRGAANMASGQPISVRGLWMPVLAYFAFAAGYIVYMTFILAWLRQQGWPWGWRTGVWATLGVGVAVSPFVWRRALDHWPPALTLSASCAVTLLGAAIPLFDATPIGLVGSAVAFGLGMFVAPSAIAVLVRQRMSPAQWAKGMTLFTVVFAAGQAVGPVGAGWIADATTLSRSLLLGLALLLVGTLLPVFGMAAERVGGYRAKRG